MYCRPEYRNRRRSNRIVDAELGRQRSSQIVKYYGTNMYDAHKDSYQIYYKYNII